MENESSTPSPEEAARALADLAADDRKIATRLVTPAWYHPIYALCVAAMTASIAIPFWGSVITLICIIGLMGLMTTYQRRYGIQLSRPTGKRSRRVLIALICILLACMAASALIGFSSLSPWLIAIPTIVNAASAYLLGRAYDNAARKDIAGE